MRDLIPPDTHWVRILWTGSRLWSEHPEELNDILEPVVVGTMAGVPNMLRCTHLHGAAQGLDRAIAGICIARDWQQEVYPVMPSDYAEHGRRAPLIRDRRMIENKPLLVVGLPHPAARTAGTWHTIRLARKAGIATLVVRRQRYGRQDVVVEATPARRRHAAAQGRIF